MEQIVTVTALLPDGRARVAARRVSACSGDCRRCGGCGEGGQTVLAEAENPIGARPGDQVVVRSRSRSVLTAAAAVYLIPLLLFFGGYTLGAALGCRPAILGGIGFALGILGCVLLDRRTEKRKKGYFEIVAFAGPSGAGPERERENEI